MLASSNNERGDVFTRLMSDVFHSLGYDQLRFNVHQTGREVDVIGTHLTERRAIIAECKATESAIGGAELNKFFGVLDAETRKAGTATAGYFASISGFTESAIQQELDARQRFILLGPKEISGHLVRGRIISSESDAISQAAKWLAESSLARARNLDLLAHESGWHWLVTFEQPGKVLTGYSVVHADGMVIDKFRASQLIAPIGYLADLEYFGPEDIEVGSRVSEARERYIRYLVKEYGSVTLEGLPADQEVGSRSLRLENIFVPLSLEISTQDSIEAASSETQPTGDPSASISEAEVDDSVRLIKRRKKNHPRELAGKILQRNNRIAILGSPGSGKTTLIKRLAVAYATPGRRTEIEDQLPDHDWFPIVLRCRHLGSNVSRPILSGIESIAERAEMPELRSALRICVTNELRAGKVLLLIDGLDEIAAASDRATFVAQLRTFLGTYPAVSLVVTSREYGFRTVAGAIATLCNTYRVAELSNNDIRKITLAWHREVVGPGATIAAQASSLTDAIIRTDRVRRLAVNPLLLTTLLLVRRWLGELPRKRSVLYAKAIEVLLMTWNVEGHQPLDPEEALPQLAFAAFCMMKQNVQSVSIRKLAAYFSEARRQMPELLGYSRLSVSEFIARVEERSSLLSLSGHVLEGGQLRPTYEFKHLTFQEYLAALAAAEGYYPDRKDGERLVDALDPYLTKPNWREVVPLAGVLGGRDSTALIERIMDLIGPEKDYEALMTQRIALDSSPEASLVELLAQCVADEVPLARSALNRAITLIITQSRSHELRQADIFSGRYAPEIYSASKLGFESFNQFAPLYAGALADAVAAMRITTGESFTKYCEEISRFISSCNDMDKIEGCLSIMRTAYTYTGAQGKGGRDDQDTLLESREGTLEDISKLSVGVQRIIETEDSPQVLFASIWALCWLTNARRPTKAQTRRMLLRLWEVWQGSSHRQLQRLCAWAIWTLPVLNRGEIRLEFTPASIAFLREEINSSSWMHSDHRRAALTIGYYLEAPWGNSELAEHVADTVPEDRGLRGNPPWAREGSWAESILRRLGPEGTEAIRVVRENTRRYARQAIRRPK